MSKSSDYLRQIPLKSAVVLALTYAIWYGLFSYLEYGSGMTSKIHGELPVFSLIIASFTMFNCNIMMAMEYNSMRRSEEALDRYLRKLGVLPA